MKKQTTNMKIDLHLLFMKSTLRRKSEYIDAKQALCFQCKKCEQSFMKRWTQVKKRNGECPNCSKRGRKKLSHEEAKLAFYNKLLKDGFHRTEEYINADKKVLCTKNGYKYSIIPSSYVNDNTIPDRYMKNPYAIENFQRWMELNAHDSQNGQSLISKEWKGTNVKLEFYCCIHDFTYLCTPNNKMASLTRCPKCALSHGGLYNIAFAEYNKDEWLKIPAIVYTIYCNGNDESFFKIGITRRTTEKRFYSNCHMPYDFIVIEELYMNLYDAVYKEDELHNKHKEYEYRPKINFGGVTECFSCLINSQNLVVRKP